MSRALNYIKKTCSQYGKERAIYEGIFIGFGSKLSIQSQSVLESQVDKYFKINNKEYILQLQQYSRSIKDYLNIYGVILLIIHYEIIIIY